MSPYIPLTKLSDRGVYPITNDAIFKLVLNDSESNLFLPFFIKNLYPFMRLAKVEVQRVDISELLSQLLSAVNPKAGKSEFQNPYSIRRAVRLDVSCQLDNGDKILLEMQASQMRGDNQLNGFVGLKNRAAYCLGRVYSDAQVEAGTESSYLFYKNLPKCYLVDICDFTVFPSEQNINILYDQFIKTSEQLNHELHGNNDKQANNISQLSNIIKQYAQIIGQKPNYNLINTASFRFPDGSLLTDSLNITIIELPKIAPLLTVPVEKLTTIEAILLYFFIAHQKQYEDKILHLSNIYEEIKILDRNLHKVIDTNRKALDQIMLHMGELDFAQHEAYIKHLLKENTAKVTDEVTAKVTDEVTAKKDRETAFALLALGTVNLAQISKITNISIEELNKLKQS
ncbi:MAG: Rpn family recombination-promoting nuclease/putative transposase [Deltaproteobacteria bacterium]|jgi:hypothetical protein|nr:Rpn family recombination-promoting nuclease/putative transposase [Deltaproteobacteria bacterium]